MINILVDKGELLTEVEAKKYDFIVKVAKGTSSSKLMELNTILKNNPGEKMGLLIFENGTGGGPKKLALNFGVAFTKEMEEDFKRILLNS